MKYLLENLEEIQKQIKSKKYIGLFLDFDGTLSAIANTPEEAFLPLIAKKIIIELQKNPKIILAIISGRRLEDIKNKVNIEGIIYAGNHGMEWEIEGQKKSAMIDGKIMQAFDKIKNKLQEMAKKIKDVFIEDKGLTIGVHYRLLLNGVRDFKKNFQRIINPYLLEHKITFIKGKKVFDIRPNINWTKGHFIELLINQVSKKARFGITSIYIGDDTTDEDVFSKLKKGITIKVGKSSNSSAKYYLKNTEEVITFLKWMSKH